MTENIHPALRVSQLDASELDSEVFSLLKSQLQNIFKYLKPRLVSTFSPEINAALRGALCYYALRNNRATIGQQLLGLQYLSEVGGATGKESSFLLSHQQKFLYSLFTVGGPWIEERMDDFKYKTRHLQYSTQIWRLVQALLGAWKIAVVINFLIFLTRGQYQFITERLLGMKPVFPSPQGVRQVGFEMMDREILWHGFAEFLFFALPLINFRRTKNFLVRHLIPSSSSTETTVSRSAADLKECVVCGEWPFNPHEIGCRHVFCYICLQSNIKADSSFSCPLCGHKSSDQDSQCSMRPVTLVKPF